MSDEITAPSEQSDNYVRALERVAREVVEKWEALPDTLPDIDGIVPLSQAIIDLRALVGSTRS